MSKLKNNWGWCVVFRINKVLIALLLILLFVAGVSGIGAVDLDSSALGADSGSGSVSDDDGSPNEDYDYGSDSNVGSADSEDESVDDPLDEEYYSSSSSSSSNGEGFTVSLSKHATGNPLFVLLLALLSIGGGIWIKH